MTQSDSLSRSLASKGSLGWADVCIPSKNLSCKFSTTFSIDFGDHQYLLKSRKAQAIFEYLGTRWLNNCGSKDESYFGLFINTEEDEIHGRKLRYAGVANGNCQGYNCPSGVSFSFPNRRLQTVLPNGSHCSGEQLMYDLLVYPDFFIDETTKPAGILFIDHTSVLYDILDECEESVCNPWEERCFSQCPNLGQREAAQAFLVEADLARYVDSSKHECEWEGFHCDINRSITGIFLRQKQVQGTISTELGKLIDLKDLDLADNMIKGTIPNEIGQLKNLQTFSLNDNLLTGSLPLEMRLLENNKEVFTVGGNSLTGSMSHYCPEDIQVDGCTKNKNEEMKEDQKQLRIRNP